MKKVYALITALVFLSCSVISVVAATINSERDQVVITENILYGDRSAADGLEIKTKNHLGYRLYWENLLLSETVLLMKQDMNCAISLFRSMMKADCCITEITTPV